MWNFCPPYILIAMLFNDSFSSFETIIYLENKKCRLGKYFKECLLGPFPNIFLVREKKTARSLATVA
jgi:hypothetical protein